MKQKGISPIPNQQGLLQSFRSVRLLPLLISLIAVGVCFLGLGIQNKAEATTYYVDNSITDTNPASATPDCTNYNTGTFTCSGGSASAYKTIADINAGSFSGDDQILFRKGQTWREQLTVPSSGTSGHPITFGAFGSGNKPIISGSNIITGWSNYSGNVWQATVTTQPNIIFFDGTRGTLETAIGNINAQYEWYWASNVLYVWSPSGSPDTYYTNPGVEAANRTAGINQNNKSYITIDGLNVRDTNGATYDSASIKFGTTSVVGGVVQNCVVERNSSTGIYAGAASTSTSFSASNNTIQNNGGFGILIDTNFTSGGNINNNTISGNGFRSIEMSQQLSGIQGNLGNYNIYNNTISNNGSTCYGGANLCHGIYYSAFGGTVNIYNNDISGQLAGAGIKVTGSANIHNNYVYGNLTDGIYFGQNSSNDVTYNIYYNIAYGNNSTDNGSSGMHEGSKGTGMITAYLYNNTVYGNTATTGMEIQLQDALTTLIMKNNIMYSSATRYTFYSPTQSGATINNNLYWRADGTPAIYYNSATRSWSTWQGYGFDAAGINDNPYFVAGTEAKPYPYFYLKSNSLAINGGTNVGLTTDYLGVSVPQGAAPDIGAFEYTVSVPENIWFFFPLFMALPRLIFLLNSRQGQRRLFILFSKREYKSLLIELYLPYLNLVSYLLKRIV